MDTVSIRPFPDLAGGQYHTCGLFDCPDSLPQHLPISAQRKSDTRQFLTEAQNRISTADFQKLVPNDLQRIDRYE